MPPPVFTKPLNRPDCSDIDVLLAPPPAAYERADADELLQPHRLLARLLPRLMARGWLHDPVGETTTKRPSWRSAKKAADPEERGASFSGTWRGPGSPVLRRIDVKVYPFALLPFGVGYFSSSRNLCRALRHYARHGVPQEHVQRLCGGAGHHFHLGNYDLVPVVYVGKGRGWQREERPAGPPVVCRCESDIYRALGLHYVPPHMRNVEW